MDRKMWLIKETWSEFGCEEQNIARPSNLGLKNKLQENVYNK